MVNISTDKNDILIDFTHEEGGEGKFIFIKVGDKIFYLNTSIGKMWATDFSMTSLGDYHNNLLKKHWKEIREWIPPSATPALTKV